MDISYWALRSTSLVSDKPLVGAACLVLLPEKLPKETILQNQILAGMLKVLALEEQELCVAWLDDGIKDAKLNLIVEAMIRWAPHTVLVLGKQLANYLLKCDEGIDKLRARSWYLGAKILMQITYHPAELETAKECKRKAYEDLLRLKKYIVSLRAI